MQIYKQKLEKDIFLPEICTFWQNTFTYCSQITVDHVHVNEVLLSSPNVSWGCKQNQTRK